jgi:membrane dipeptidase
MVDISHVADKTFTDVLALTTVPVIASHSSCRAIANHPRNMTDDMMRALGRNGGVIMINYEVSFLSEENRAASEKSGGVVAALDRMSKTCGGDEACSTLESARMTREAMDKGLLPAVSWEKIVEHIDHAAKVAGVDHVGLGSDFDGATMPIGMEDASQLPKLTTALMAKGYSAADVEKILGGNILRVMEQVEQGAARARQ